MYDNNKNIYMFIKKVLRNVYTFLITKQLYMLDYAQNRKTFSNSQVTYQKELLLFEKSGYFFHRVNIEIGLTPPPPGCFVFCFLRIFHPSTPPSRRSLLLYNEPFIKKIEKPYRHKEKI